jgi:hypothetical protein
MSSNRRENSFDHDSRCLLRGRKNRKQLLVVDTSLHIRTNQNASPDELDLWMPDSKSFGVGGKMRQTSVRRPRCPNKSASGNHLNQNVPRRECGDVR